MSIDAESLCIDIPTCRDTKDCERMLIDNDCFAIPPADCAYLFIARYRIGSIKCMLCSGGKQMLRMITPIPQNVATNWDR